MAKLSPFEAAELEYHEASVAVQDDPCLDEGATPEELKRWKRWEDAFLAIKRELAKIERNQENP